MLSNNKNKLNGTYVYRHKHNYMPCSTFTITKVQLHVSAINVDHPQVVHEELINKEKGGMDWGCLAPVHTLFLQHKTRSRTHLNPQTVNSPHMLV